MTCAGCEAAVRIAARGVDGVTDVQVSHTKGSAEVTFDPSKTNPDASRKPSRPSQVSRQNLSGPMAGSRVSDTRRHHARGGGIFARM
jgi:cation transport ATPase